VKVFPPLAWRIASAAATLPRTWWQVFQQHSRPPDLFYFAAETHRLRKSDALILHTGKTLGHDPADKFEHGAVLGPKQNEAP
jgi:hypothetical protein